MARHLIMLVDPIEDDWALQAHVLRQAGHTVMDGSADPFESAVHAVPDAIVIDVTPARAGSIELLRRLKEDPRTSRIPVVTVSTYPQRDLTTTEGYVEKPSRPTVLLAEVARVLGG